MLDTKLRHALHLLVTIKQHMKTGRLCIETGYLLQLMFLAGEPIMLANYSTHDLMGKSVVFPSQLADYLKRFQARLRLRLIPESWEIDFLELIIIPLGGFIVLKPLCNDANIFLEEVVSFMKTRSYYNIRTMSEISI
jgi:hypothetical protein